jgi:hypothetical protein
MFFALPPGFACYSPKASAELLQFKEPTDNT